MAIAVRPKRFDNLLFGFSFIALSPNAVHRLQSVALIFRSLPHGGRRLSPVFSPCKTAELAFLFPPLDIDPSGRRPFKGTPTVDWRLEFGHLP
jgi:hypothetical protein